MVPDRALLIVSLNTPCHFPTPTFRLLILSDWAVTPDAPSHYGKLVSFSLLPCFLACTPFPLLVHSTVLLFFTMALAYEIKRILG